MINWHLETIPIKDLKPHPKNPRQITKEQQQHLENLLNTFGVIEKPIVNLDKTIIGGHQRIKILKKNKVKEVECWMPDRNLNENEVEHLLVGLNLNQGKFDYDCLANLWEPIQLLEYGFTEEQLMGTFQDIEKEESLEKKKKSKVCPECGHSF